MKRASRHSLFPFIELAHPYRFGQHLLSPVGIGIAHFYGLKAEKLSVAVDHRFRTLLEQLLMQANPIYGDLVRKGTLGELELVFVQQQTYRLYRDMMIMKGVSPNQLKPVRVIDTPFKKNFFFGLKE